LEIKYSEGKAVKVTSTIVKSKERHILKSGCGKAVAKIRV
jgi:hypothetical protein